MFRFSIFIAMVSSFFVLGAYDCFQRNWRTGIASVLLGIVQMLIFYEGK